MKLRPRPLSLSQVWDAARGYCDPDGRFKAAVPRGPQGVVDSLDDFGVKGSLSAATALAFSRAVSLADPRKVDWTRLDEFACEPKHIAMPTLLVYGADDPYSSEAEQTALFGAIGAVEKSLVALPGCDHAAHLLKRREIWFAAVVEFARRARLREDAVSDADAAFATPEDAAVALHAREEAAAAKA